MSAMFDVRVWRTAMFDIRVGIHPTFVFRLCRSDVVFRSVMLNRAEIVLHDHFGDHSYWEVSDKCFHDCLKYLPLVLAVMLTVIGVSDPNGSCLFAAGLPTDIVGCQNFLYSTSTTSWRLMRRANNNIGVSR